jgi:hypothetical protein
MKMTVEELRAEARRLREAANNVSDPEVKKELAARALALSERAEALANSAEDPEIIAANIERYRSLLASSRLSVDEQRIVQEMLADAEASLAALGKNAP